MLFTYSKRGTPALPRSPFWGSGDWGNGKVRPRCGDRVSITGTGEVPHHLRSPATIAAAHAGRLRTMPDLGGSTEGDSVPPPSCVPSPSVPPVASIFAGTRRTASPVFRTPRFHDRDPPASRMSNHKMSPIRRTVVGEPIRFHVSRWDEGTGRDDRKDRDETSALLFLAAFTFGACEK